jgi:hypothetical protein
VRPVVVDALTGEVLDGLVDWHLASVAADGREVLAYLQEWESVMRPGTMVRTWKHSETADAARNAEFGRVLQRVRVERR